MFIFLICFVYVHSARFIAFFPLNLNIKLRTLYTSRNYYDGYNSPIREDLQPATANQNVPFRCRISQEDTFQFLLRFFLS